MKKLFGVLGNPIEHSMSPLIHNDAFEKHSVEGVYLPFCVEDTELQQAVEGMKALGAGGFNVTVPFKSRILPYIDVLDDFANEVGAVNTVVIKEGCLYGYNTDGPGFVKGLLTVTKQIDGKNVLIIGAGGAARGIYFALAKTGVAKLDLANRTVSSAEQIVADYHGTISSSAISLREAERTLGKYDIIIQTTSVGLANIDATPLSLEELNPGAIVCDIIYNPLQTRILKEAKERGNKVQNGVDMFVYQGALAFELWTGIMPDTERMKQLVLQQLGGS